MYVFMKYFLLYIYILIFSINIFVTNFIFITPINNFFFANTHTYVCMHAYTYMINNSRNLNIKEKEFFNFMKDLNYKL